MTNIIELVTTTIKAVGTGDADWRVQAGAAVLLVIVGLGGLGVEKIRQKRKARKESK
ncbi:MAG: hypothetical protein WC130_04410 [Kiritimatiellia bacterium]